MTSSQVELLGCPTNVFNIVEAKTATMNIMVVGASKGLGKAFIEGLGHPGDRLVGVSRSMPRDIQGRPSVAVDWIAADLADAKVAVPGIARHVREHGLDVLIYNLGVWEESAFEASYRFFEDTDTDLRTMVDINVTSAILLIKRLLPTLLQAEHPRLILTGSTSGLPGSGRPEVTFAASKFALRGIGEALREGFRAQRLAVTCLQIGYLNTQDSLSVPVDVAASRGNGEFIPVHDVVSMVRALLELSGSSFIKEIVMPAISDARY